jgi:hypothetical protein
MGAATRRKVEAIATESDMAVSSRRLSVKGNLN